MLFLTTPFLYMSRMCTKMKNFKVVHIKDGYVKARRKNEVKENGRNDDN